MRYAIIGDIHANLAAFKAVLEDIERQGGAKKIWCLGDIVGYGPDPHQCLELLRQTNHTGVAGNHDWAAIGKIDTSDFNPDAVIACRWTATRLTQEDKDYLAALPLTVEEDEFTLAHGSPREPLKEYLISIGAASVNFNFFKTQFCLVGHSHLPLVFINDDGVCSSSPFLVNVKLALGKNRLIINPGAVGQPRDNNLQASYAMYDSEARQVKLYRLPYDTGVTQDRMVEYGLPMRLVARLSYGI